VPLARRQHRRRQCLAQWRLGHGLTPAAPVQQRARAVDADRAAIVLEPNDDQLRRIVVG
jgi:hypothetical protein